jgi:DnaK suppressor protein
MDAVRAGELLAAERQRVEHAIASLGPESAALKDEPGDESSENLYQAEFDSDRAEELAEHLAAVERAEARLADGTYGLSIETGKPIPDDRLEAMPTAEHNVDELGRHRPRFNWATKPAGN